MDECAAGTDDCVADATCADTASGFTCTCRAGFTGDGTADGTGCTDVNECATATDNCVDLLADCTDGDGSFSCSCIDGYTGDGTTDGTGCTDIDECALGTDDCGTLDCVNGSGAFSCAAWFMPRPRQSTIDRMDSSFRFLDRLVATSTAGTVSGISGMVIDPTSQEIYAVVGVAGSRRLGTLNPSTGVVTDLGNLGTRFASLAFDSTGQLWGVTGDGGSPAETLFRIDKTNATTTLARALGAGSDGECIAYHPLENMLYHWSGSGPVVVERIDLGTPGLDITPITTTGSSGSEPYGCRYDATLNLFLAWDSSRTVRTMTAAGVYAATAFITPATVRAGVYVPTSGHDVTPASGPIAGGTAITLTGVGLDRLGPTPALTVGGVAATDLVVVNSRTLTAVTPAGAAGVADLVLTGNTPTPYSWPDAFTYEATLARATETAAPELSGSTGCSSGASSSLLALAIAALAMTLVRRRVRRL